jgi:hypothetical protein
MSRPKTSKPSASFAGKHADESRRLDQSNDEGVREDYVPQDRDHLLSLDKLLNAAQDLMRQEPALDKAAFEHLRQLRVKVRFAISASAPDRAGSLPTKAPSFWEQRPQREISPLKFLVDTYKTWLEAGTICRADIRRLDKPLYLAIYRSKTTDKQLNEIGLPTKARLIDRKLEQWGSVKAPSRSMRLGELPVEERDQFRLYQASRSRRKKHHPP